MMNGIEKIKRKKERVPGPQDIGISERIFL